MALVVCTSSFFYLHRHYLGDLSLEFPFFPCGTVNPYNVLHSVGGNGTYRRQYGLFEVAKYDQQFSQEQLAAALQKFQVQRAR